MAQFPCFKCGGSGEVAFRHIANGVCFQCGGTGRLSVRPAAEFQYRDKPGFPVLPESERGTAKQWDYLAKLTGDVDGECRRFIAQAGCPHATDVYVSRAVMSRAIELAKRARGAGA